MSQEFSNWVDLLHERGKTRDVIHLLRTKKMATLSSSLAEAYDSYLEDKGDKGFAFKTRLIGEQVHKLYEHSLGIHNLVRVFFFIFSTFALTFQHHR